LRVDKLAEDFREGRVSEKERYKYYLATFIALNLIIEFFFHFGGKLGTERLMPVAVNLGATVAGITLCYRTSKKGNDTDFVERMICLGWPIGMWCILLIFAVSLTVVVALSLLPDEFFAFVFLGGDPHYLMSREMGRDVLWWLESFLVCFYFAVIYLFLRRLARVEGAESSG